MKYPKTPDFLEGMVRRALRRLGDAEPDPEIVDALIRRTPGIVTLYLVRLADEHAQRVKNLDVSIQALADLAQAAIDAWDLQDMRALGEVLGEPMPTEADLTRMGGADMMPLETDLDRLASAWCPPHGEEL